MKRSEIREILFMLLFRAEFNDIAEMPQQIQYYFAQDSKTTEAEQNYITAREESILEKLPQIDDLIREKAVGWTIERMGKVDLAIIRLAVYEISFDEDIPTGVSINEAVELAKKYGRDESAGFVNGVLAKFA